MKNSIIVVDANIAIKWVTDEESDSHIATALLLEWSTQHKTILVPVLFVYEITNILHKKVRQGKITLEGAKKAASSILDMGIEISYPFDPEVPVNSLDFASRFKLPATYDAHYLALAEREACEFWTADARLYNSVRDQFSWVRFMADPPLSATSA